MGDGRRPALRLAAAFAALVLAGCGAGPGTAKAGDEQAAARAERGKSEDMDPEHIMELMARFLRADFGLQEAQETFGPVASDKNPNVLTLKHINPSVERASLQMADYRGERFVGSVFIKLREPLRIKLTKLEEAYGPSREMPRLKPDQPIPTAFDVGGGDFPGRLVLGLEPGSGSTRMLRTVLLERIPEDL